MKRRWTTSDLAAKSALPPQPGLPSGASGQAGDAVKLDIKPLSVNSAWKGQRFKTDAYRNYEKAVLLMLPKISLPAPPYKLSLVFGFSNLASDLDNPAKCFIDCMQKAYVFNDKHIAELNIKKELVGKGCEFITFNIQTADSAF